MGETGSTTSLHACLGNVVRRFKFKKMQEVFDFVTFLVELLSKGEREDVLFEFP